jgi:hypothetical protein
LRSPARTLALSLSLYRPKRHGKATSQATPDGDDSDGGFETAKGKRKGKKKSMDPSLLGFSVESSRIMQGELDFPE